MPTSQDYALFVGQVNKLTERRQAVTSTYLSVNAAIVGARVSGNLSGYHLQSPDGDHSL